ncbi:MAG: excinuclease UvrABC helicase subunit UvrB [Arenicella sp.]|jgi:excinuclease UvrABC helicase subunit UvrB
MGGLEKEMYKFAEGLEFEQAARTRDRIEELRSAYLKK